jgi:hypothetical protein
MFPSGARVQQQKMLRRLVVMEPARLGVLFTAEESLEGPLWIGEAASFAWRVAAFFAG